MFLKYRRLILSAFLVVFFAVLFVSVFRTSFEGDELIYRTLAIKLENFQNYNLKDTQLLNTLPKQIYDTEIFFYPPTFISILSLFHIFLGELGFKLVAPLLFIVFCFVIYKTVYLLTESKNIAYKSLLISTFSPMLLFLSVRSSMDLFMSTAALTSFYFIVKFKKEEKKIFIFLSGLFIVIAILTKYIPVILLLFFVPLLLEILYKKKMLKNIYLFFIPFFLLILWGVYFLSFNPSFSFFLHSKTSGVLETYKFLDYAYQRPVYFYFLNTLLLNPFSFFLISLFIKKHLVNLFKKYGKIIILLIEIVVLLFLSFTLIGVLGGTYQMRYIFLAEPFLIILLSLINFKDNKLARNLLILFIIHNIFIFIFNVVILNGPDNFPLVDLSRFLKLGRLE